MNKEYKLYIKNIFDSYKCKNDDDILKCIPIYDDKNCLSAYLVPIIEKYRSLWSDCTSCLAKWRNENPSISAADFTATAESTQKWLDNLVIGRDDRILFLIVSLEAVVIGHLGYSSFNYDKKSCEVDAVLRGKKSYKPGIMTYALNSLISWGKNSLKLEDIQLRVFSDNITAINFYKRNGFYIIDEDVPVDVNSEKTYTVMQLNKIM